MTLISPFASVPCLHTSGNPSTTTTITRTLFATPRDITISPTAITASTTSTLSFTSPKMGFLSTSSARSSHNILFGYHGHFDFLDNDDKFLVTFGRTTNLLHVYPVSGDNNEVFDIITPHMDRCRLDVFMWLCKQDYVGITSSDNNLSLIELRQALSTLKQEHKEGNETILGTPDELFDNFMAIATCFPQDDREWPINLCSTFQSGLNHDLGDTMENDTTFQQPDLTSLTTKSLQLDALRWVQAHAVVHFKRLQDQTTQIGDAIRSLMGSRHHSNMHFTNLGSNTGQQPPYDPTNLNHTLSGVQRPQSHSKQWPPHGDKFFQRNQSQAEQTMQRYKPDDGYAQGGKHSQPEVPRKLNPSTNQLHPWNEDHNYLSHFPLGFRSYFICGGTDHWGSHDFLLLKMGGMTKNYFLRNCRPINHIPNDYLYLKQMVELLQTSHIASTNNPIMANGATSTVPILFIMAPILSTLTQLG